MESIGIDVHKVHSQVCIFTDDGEVLERGICMEVDRFEKLLGGRPKARILIEASTESEWVARSLENLGHEVVVVDPNFAAMYATRSRRVKTDRRDARTLADACRLGAYRPAHRLSEAQRHIRAELIVRESLVRTRTRYISVIRTLVRRDGLRVRSGSSDTFVDRLGEIDLPEVLRSEIAPLVALMEPLRDQIQTCDARVEERAKEDEVVRRLCTAPGNGPVTAAPFVATLDTAGRFERAHQVEAYLGLVPREMSSGEKQRKGRMTKAGNSRARSLLMESAWCIMRWKKPETEELRTWAERIARRRGKSKAAVALARRLAGILYAMWRDGTEYTAQRAAVQTEESLVTT